MCGIVGKVSPGEPVDPQLLERMCAAVAHRGPDSRGTFLDGGVALGVQRLRVIDLDTGDQPIFNEDGTVAVVLNGEIYNYEQLRRGLLARGHRLATRSDTEVIAHLYEELGPRCVERLRGMFAFALWDARRRRLVLARDRVGKKPLLYARKGDTLWFASEPAGILADAEVGRDVDWAAIDRYLSYGYVPHPATGFAALRKLPPAHVAVWEDGSLRTERYWSLSFRDGPEASAAERAERVRAALLEATRLRLRSDVRVGALLSGGIDSSAVVAAMARESTGTVRTFSIGFADPEYDESPHARAVAEHCDTEHHELEVGPADAEELLPAIVAHHGEPFADLSSVPSFRLAALAREHVTVVLNGDGGDESFAGYPRYARIGARRLLGSSAAAARAYAPHLVLATEEERAGLQTPWLRAATAGSDRLDVIRSPLAGSDARPGVERWLDVDIQTYLPGDLMAKQDTAAMAHGLEARSPFLDHVFLETAAALPAEAKLAGQTTKAVLREAVRPWLPDEVLTRPKMGFLPPLSGWLRGPLAHLPGDVLLDPASVARGLFRPARVRRLISEHCLGAADHGAVLWSLIILELWQRALVDRPAVGAAA
jgi:asparagine synthase (glutamine-hydrolysing)